ncbi:two pore domain potassium channel family protein [Candidatus Poribacteria bacterium]|nr:two pore domain potassium channel family protein [Candidatus Poribacteria bacterium]
MTGQEHQARDKKNTANRFVFLLVALAVLLVGYPYFQDNQFGAFLGGLVSLALLISSAYAVRAQKWAVIVASGLALLTASASIMAFIKGIRGHPLVEASFFLFYAFSTIVIFLEVIKSTRITAETIYGVVCVYLLIGVTFGTLYDLIETLEPESFRINVPVEGDSKIGWRHLIFFSFMTLTSIGYGDITPATFQSQSLASIEGVIGVMYVAVLIARMVSIHSQTPQNLD